MKKTLGIFLAVVSLWSSVHADVADVRIVEANGGGGLSGATYKNDYVVLFNNSTTTANLSGTSLQYASAIGGTWQSLFNNPTFTIPANSFCLIQMASGGAVGATLPTPDLTSAVNIATAAGKLAFINGTGTASGNCPAAKVDLLGYGSAANCSLVSPTANLSSSTSAQRTNPCVDTRDNLADYTVTSSMDPRNTSSATNTCSGATDTPTPTITPTNTPIVTSTFTPTITSTATPTPTPAITLTFTPTSTPTPTPFICQCNIYINVMGGCWGGPFTFGCP